MRRNRLTSIGVLTSGLTLAVGAMVGVMPAGGATPSSTDAQTTVQAVQNAAAAAVAEATGSAAPTGPGPASDPLPSLPASVAAPITALSNEIGSTMLPGQIWAPARTRQGNRLPWPTPMRRSMSARSPSAPSPTPAAAVRRPRSDWTSPAAWWTPTPHHGAGQRHRPAERSGYCVGPGERPIRVDDAGWCHQRRRTRQYLLGQCRPRRQHRERLRHLGHQRTQLAERHGRRGDPGDRLRRDCGDRREQLGQLSAAVGPDDPAWSSR